MSETKCWQLTPEQFAQYEAPGTDKLSYIRQLLPIPKTKYYSVTLWPTHLVGRVVLTGDRVPPVHKISKSG